MFGQEIGGTVMNSVVCVTFSRSASIGLNSAVTVATACSALSHFGPGNRCLGFERFDAVRDHRPPLDLGDTRLGGLHVALFAPRMLAEPDGISSSMA